MAIMVPPDIETFSSLGESVLFTPNMPCNVRESS